MTGRENRRQRREALRKARKLTNKQGPLNALRAEPLPTTSPAPTSAPQPSALALMAEMRAKAERELEQEFGAEFIAHARQVSDRIAGRLGLPTSSGPRAEINRANAQLSTGPRTAHGKLASSRNSLKHGLSTGTLLIPGEDEKELESLRDSLRREHQPADATEQMLLDQLAQSHWLLQRALRFQNGCFTADDVDEKRLALFIRYGSAHERAFHKALNALLRLKKERCRTAPASQKHPSAPDTGFVSQNNSSGSGVASGSGFVSHSVTIPNLDCPGSRPADRRNSPSVRDEFPSAA